MYNDSIRDNKHELQLNEDEKTQWFENLDALIELLDPKDFNQAILFAEVLRYKRAFEEALSLLDN